MKKNKNITLIKIAEFTSRREFYYFLLFSHQQQDTVTTPAYEKLLQ